MSHPLAIAIRTLAVIAATTLVSGAALAQSGINLSWDDCGVSGLAQRNFACNSNAGSYTMVASVITGADLPAVTGIQAALELQTNQFSLRDWWQLGAAGCRSGALGVTFDFTSGSDCEDPWAGATTGSVSYQPGVPYQNAARIQVTGASPAGVAMNGISEYNVFGLTLSTDRSVGAGSCAGCSDGVCIMLCEVRLSMSGGAGSVRVFTPIVRNYVQWQPAVPSTCNLCGTPVPARTPTWGAVKTLYR